MLDQPPFPQKPAPGNTQQQQIAQPVAQPGGEDIDAIVEEPAPEQEQAQYDMLMAEAYELLASDKAFPFLDKIVKEDPVNGVADATLGILNQLEADNGQQDPELLQGIAEEIIPEIMKVAETQGVDIPEADGERIAAVAASKWIQANPDRIDQEGMTLVGNAATQSAGGFQDVQAG